MKTPTAKPLTALENAKLLAVPKPGVVVAVPLVLLPAYFQLHQVEAMRMTITDSILTVRKKENDCAGTKK